MLRIPMCRRLFSAVHLLPTDKLRLRGYRATLRQRSRHLVARGWELGVARTLRKGCLPAENGFGQGMPSNSRRGVPFRL